MAIADELTKLEANRANIVRAINNKGGELAENAGLAACPEAISQLGSAGGTTLWTGHVDEAGLRYIGWDDEDIANLKADICWNEEDDELYAVPQDHKDLWDACEKVVVNGRTMIAYSELSKWLDLDFLLRYLPFTDFSSVTNISNLLMNKQFLIALPDVNWVKVTDMTYSFKNCINLLYIPNFGDVKSLTGSFYNCPKLKKVSVNSCATLDIENSGLEIIEIRDKSCIYTSANLRNCSNIRGLPVTFDASKVRYASYMFSNCTSLENVDVTFDAVTECRYMFAECRNLKKLPQISSKIKYANFMFSDCVSINDMPDYDFSECTVVANIFSGLQTVGNIRIDFPAAAEIRSAANNVRCKKIYFKFYQTNTNMMTLYGIAVAYEMEFDSASVLTGVTNANNLPFKNASNRINKEAVTYKLVKEVCEMLIRGIPNYTAASYPMYFESGSTVSDDAAGTLQSLVEQCQAMKWAIYNLTINPYTE